jgi:multidrug resistance efflux pump
MRWIMKGRCWLFFLVALLLAAQAPAQVKDELQQKANEAAPPAQPVLEKKGYLVAVRTVAVSSEVSGRVTLLHCEEGTDVKQGDLLAQLDAARYEAEYKRADAVVKRARAQLQERLDRKELPDVARAELLIAEAERDKARHELEETKVRAPFDGTILVKKAEVGGVLDRLHFNGYFAVCEMADLTRLEVDVSVEERDIRQVFVGQRCQVRTDAFPEKVYPCEVARILPTADRAKSCIVVRIRIPLAKRDPKLRPEMGAIVSFLRNGQERN